MNRPEDYVKNSHLKEVIGVLDEFEDEFVQMKGKCIDIGCGPGEVGRKLILPRLPADVKLIGIDVSQKMIDYAQKTNKDERRITFKVLNIESPDLPKEDIESYDNSVSFFCLQWIQDLNRCYRNIFKILRPGGNFIVHTIISGTPYFAYLTLAQNPLYKLYMKDVMRVISPLHFDENPRKTVKDIVQKVGFKISHCSLREETRIFTSEEKLMALLLGINPFVDRMPENMRQIFMNETLQEVKKHSIVFHKRNEKGLEKENIEIKYTFMVAHFRKPMN